MLLPDNATHQGIHRVHLGLGLHDQALPVFRGHRGGVFRGHRSQLILNLIEVLFSQELFKGAVVTKGLIKLQVE